MELGSIGAGLEWGEGGLVVVAEVRVGSVVVLIGGILSVVGDCGDVKSHREMGEGVSSVSRK